MWLVAAGLAASSCAGLHYTQADAGRFASQLAAEINRYKQPAAAAQLADLGLAQRLAGDIEESHGLQPGPAPAAATTGLGMFDEALGKMLGNADGREATQPLLVVKT